MADLKSVVRPLAITLGMLLVGSEMALSHPLSLTSTQSKQFFGQPRGGGLTSAAGRSRSGSHRGACASVPSVGLAAFMPDTNVGLTIDAHPTFLLYMPYDQSTHLAGAKFMLLDQELRPVLSAPIPISLPQHAGVIQFRLPETAPALEVGQRYNWYFSVICDAQKPSRNPVVSGWIERINPDEALTSALSTTTQADYRIYASNGIWFDAIARLANQHCQNPQNPTVRDDWNQMLQEAEMTDIADQPVICGGDR